MKDKWCYENTLSDPESLNAFYTILDTYINDVAKIIPESHRIPQATNEPTLNELNAKRMRKAYNLPHLLPTKLQIRKWED